MKPNLHPMYNKIMTKCACGNTFETRSTSAAIRARERGPRRSLPCSNHTSAWVSSRTVGGSAGARVGLFRGRVGDGLAPHPATDRLNRHLKANRVRTDTVRRCWLHAANTGLFVVYNENRDTDRDPLGIGVRDRSLRIKYSHTFDLLD